MEASTGTKTWIAAIGAVLAVQSVLLGWALARPGTLPWGTSAGVVGLAALSALLLGYEARSAGRREEVTWWRPDWPRWALGSVLPGPNAGVFLAYLLRRREAVRADAPSGRWKLPLVAGVLVVTARFVVSTILPGTGTSSPARAALLVVVLGVVGFTAVAAYYDLQYVTLALSAAGRDWFAGGHHWLAPLSVPFPGRVFFLALYLFRRRVLLGRVADGEQDIERLPTGVGPTEASDDRDEPATLPVDE
jgi:hypothetical protein